jgi:poly(3-hydroxybutyrate) depolymerase
MGLIIRFFISFAVGIFLLSCEKSEGSRPSSENQALKVEFNPEASPEHCLPKLTSFLPNPNAPRIGLLGQKVIHLSIGEPYVDAGAVAEDNQDGNLTDMIKAIGLDNMDVNQARDYFIRYAVTDRDGNSAISEYRMVRVSGEAGYAGFSKRRFSEVDSVWEFVEHLPSDFGKDEISRYPLLIVNHGWGHSKRYDASGSMSAIHGQAIVNMLEQNRWDESLPFIVLVPQRCWSDVGDAQINMLNNFVQWAIRNYSVDTSRIYMTGLSMGGWVTWEYLRLFHGVVAAAAPMSGGGSLSCDIDDTPIWAFTARDDATVPFTDVTATVNTLKTCNARAHSTKITVFPSGGHVIDDDVFNDNYLSQGLPSWDLYDQNIFEWFLTHQKPSP